LPPGSFMSFKHAFEHEHGLQRRKKFILLNFESFFMMQWSVKTFEDESETFERDIFHPIIFFVCELKIFILGQL